MNTTNTGLSWFYYNPFFGHDKIVADGNTGIIESGVNIVLWGTVAGFAAHALGSAHAKRWAVGTFVVLVAAEYLFNASASVGGATISNGGGAPGTMASSGSSPQQYANTATIEQGGYGTVEEGGYGEQ